MAPDEQPELFKDLDSLDTHSVGVFYYPLQYDHSSIPQRIEVLSNTIRIINHTDMVMRFSDVNNASPEFNSQIINWLLKIKKIVWKERDRLEEIISTKIDLENPHESPKIQAEIQASNEYSTRSQ